MPHLIFICTCNPLKTELTTRSFHPSLSPNLGWFLARSKTADRPAFLQQGEDPWRLQKIGHHKIHGEILTPRNKSQDKSIHQNTDHWNPVSSWQLDCEFPWPRLSHPKTRRRVLDCILQKCISYHPFKLKNIASWWENLFWGSWLYWEIWVNNVVWIDFPFMSLILVLDSSLLRKLSYKNCQDKRKKLCP